MVTRHRFQITLAALSSACVLLAFSSPAFAQSGRDVACRPTETQAECHARLKCTAYEELEECQKRLQREGNAGGQTDANDRGGNRDTDRRDGADDNRDDRGERADRGERGSRGNDSGRRRDRDRGSRSHRRRGGRRGGGGGGGGGFEANKTFGLGLELGEPTGLNGKYFVSDAGAIDFGLGWIYRHYYYGDGVHLYADYLAHPVSLVSAAAFEMPLYIGGGLRFWEFDYCDRDICTYGGSAIGIRVPVGIAFDFNNVPLDIFLQLVPVIDFVRGDYYDRYGDRAHFGIDLSAGIRFWFK